MSMKFELQAGKGKWRYRAQQKKIPSLRKRSRVSQYNHFLHLQSFPSVRSQYSYSSMYGSHVCRVQEDVRPQPGGGGGLGTSSFVSVLGSRCHAPSWPVCAHHPHRLASPASPIAPRGRLCLPTTYSVCVGFCQLALALTGGSNPPWSRLLTCQNF